MYNDQRVFTPETTLSIMYIYLILSYKAVIDHHHHHQHRSSLCRGYRYRYPYCYCFTF